ncbi:MAG: DNA-directed RNA polymerase subunit omega [bacterium]
MEIISLPIEFDFEKLHGRFGLVNIAAQRAKQLMSGSIPKIESKHRKVATIALEEAIQTRVEFLVGQEAIQAKEEAKKLDYKRLLEEKRRESEKEELTELEKDLKIYLYEKEGAAEEVSAETLFREENEEEGAEE